MLELRQQVDKFVREEGVGGGPLSRRRAKAFWSIFSGGGETFYQRVQ